MCSFMMQVGVVDGGSDGVGLQPSWSAGKGGSGHRHQTAILPPFKKGTRCSGAPGIGELTRRRIQSRDKFHG